MLNRKRTIDYSELILVINTSLICIEIGGIVYVLKNIKNAFKR